MEQLTDAKVKCTKCGKTDELSVSAIADIALQSKQKYVYPCPYACDGQMDVTFMVRRQLERMRS